MSFDIDQLDSIDPLSSESEIALENYQSALLSLFSSSEEGKAYLSDSPEMGFWVESLIYYGYRYTGVTVPQMTVDDVDEILTEIFPSKISLAADSEASEAIPELTAFWQYLLQQYHLPNASAILRFLEKIGLKFPSILLDESKFGMAKSFFMMGQKAGFDMTDSAAANEFISHYNANLLSSEPQLQSSLDEDGLLDLIPRAINPKRIGQTHSNSKQRKRRKLAKASRKRNRKKRK